MIRVLFICIVFCFTYSLYAIETGVDVKPHPNAESVPAKLQSAIKSDPKQYMGDLIDFLLHGINDDRVKVKIIHDWIALNVSYDAEGYFGSSEPVYDAYDVIRKGKSVCAGYANVFELMCRQAGIESVIIDGFGRGYGFNPLDISGEFESNHAWNGVNIGNRWYLVDVTWDAGYISGRKFVKSYSTGYLLTPPEDFIYSHMPQQPQWQLLSNAVTFEEFKQQPVVKPRFFENKMTIPENMTLLKKVGNHDEFNIPTPPGIFGMADMLNEDNKICENGAFVQRDGENLNIKCIFPEPGKYIVRLYIKNNAEKGQYWDAIEFSFQASSGSRKKFPLSYSDFNLLSANIKSPVLSPLTIGKSSFFDVIVIGKTRVGVYNGKEYTDLTPGTGSSFSGNIKIEGSMVSLYYFENSRYVFLAKWNAGTE